MEKVSIEVVDSELVFEVSRQPEETLARLTEWRDAWCAGRNLEFCEWILLCRSGETDLEVFVEVRVGVIILI